MLPRVPASVLRTGRFGPFGGQYVAPPLLPLLRRLTLVFAEALADAAFHDVFRSALREHVGRPTRLHRADRMTARLAGARIYLKREDLTDNGGSYANSALGQCLLAARMGVRHVVADTGSGDNGVAAAAVAARLGLDCTVFMAAEDMSEQHTLVTKMRAYGARVEAVHAAGATLHDAMGAAIRHWMANGDSCFYVAGAPVGPHPYPLMVRSFQSVIGQETRAQLLEAEGALPDGLVAAAGGGGAALGLFTAFKPDRAVRLYAAEAAGRAAGGPSRLEIARIGVLHGAMTTLLQSEDGQVVHTASVASGLRYPAVAPELAALHARGRVQAVGVGDAEAVASQRTWAAAEGLVVSIESAHALAAAERIAPRLGAQAVLVAVITSGGDKDLDREGLLQ